MTSSLSPISVTSVGQVVEHPRRLEAVDPRPQLRLAELHLLADPDQAGARRPPCGRPARRPRGCRAGCRRSAAMSGTLATIFSLEKSRKWIIREGLNGISRIGAGAPMARGFPKSRGFRTAVSCSVALQRYRRRDRASGVPDAAGMLLAPLETTQESEHARSRDRPGRARGQRRPPLRPLPRGVRGRRRVQALAGQDGDRGRRPPVLPDHDEPPPAAHQRRLRQRSPSRAATWSSGRWSTRWRWG